jgi:tetratricopeptide (TPR) repeat protein
MVAKKKKLSTKKKQSPKLKIWQYLLLLVIPLVVFGRSINFDFVMHDDDKMIRDNAVLANGFDPGLAFKTDAWFMDARIELYRPVQSISYMVDYAIGKDNPMIYHVHNLIVYLLGVMLLLFFLSNYFKPLLSWAGTLLYSLNLLTPHVTGWIAARGDLYLMVFGLTFLILVQHYIKSRLRLSLVLTIPAFFLALLSKESAVALLPIALVMLYADKRTFPSSLEWIWLTVNTALFGGYYIMRGSAIADAGNMSAVAFFSNLRALPEEFFKMIVPVGFSVMPGYSLVWTLCGAVVMAGLIYLIKKYPPSFKVLLTGGAIWLISLLPSMAYEPSFAGVAYDYLDHRAWFPFVGLWMIIMGVAEKATWPSNRLAPVIFFALLMLWAGVDFWRVGIYDGWKPYYANAIKTNPQSGLANLNYGSLLRDEGNWDEAIDYIQKGVQLSPDYSDAKVRLAEAYFKTGKYAEAIEVTNQVLEKEPQNVSALQFRGSALGASGQSAAAALDFKTILDLDPDNVHGMFNLGIAYKDANQLNQAIEMFSQLIVAQPDFPNAYYERGFCYGKMGLFPQAKADMTQSLVYQPNHGPSYFFRGRAFEALGSLGSACADWKKAFELGTTEAEPYLFERCQEFK